MTQCVSLWRILQSFSAPISEEHGWGLIHQACLTLSSLSPPGLLLLDNTRHLLVSDDGLVLGESFTTPANNRTEMRSFTRAVAELGVVVYTALDFSLMEEESRSLSSGLEHLIDMMTSADLETSQEEDEGFGEEERGREVLEAVLESCRHHLAVSGEAASHYRAVVRALVSESRELESFMSGLDSDLLADLDRSDWGVIWTHVMSQLRQGVKLKKVHYSKTPVEFSLTPYEMLMDDIRGKKYQLNPVKFPLEVQRGAREIILDFIRSRPPLKSVAHRKVEPRKAEFTPAELLMNEIRGSEAKSRLKKASTVEKTLPDIDGFTVGKVVTKSAPKKVIQLDESFVENILNFDESGDGPEIEDSPKEVKNSKPKLPNADVAQDESSPVLVKNIKLNEPKPCNRDTNLHPERSHEKVQPTTASSTTGGKSKYSDWILSLHTLDLSLAEVAHIRSQLTKAELEERDLSRGVRRDLERGRLCFLCGRVRFGLFTWAVLCQLCTRYVCSSCVAKISLPSDKLKDIPVCSLTTQLSKEQSAESKVSSGGSFSRSLERHSFRSGSRPSRAESQTAAKPRLSRAKSMDKSMVETIRTMNLTGSRTGIQHNMCLDCKDMLTSIVRAQRMAAKLDRMRGGFRRLGGQGFDAMRE